MSNFFKTTNTILGVLGIFIIIKLLLSPINLIFTSNYKYTEAFLISPYLIYIYIIVNILGFISILTIIFQPFPRSTKAFNWGLTTLLSMSMLIFCAYYIMRGSSFYSIDPDTFTKQDIVSFSKFVIYGTTAYGVLAIISIFLFIKAPSYFANKLYKLRQESNCIGDYS